MLDRPIIVHSPKLRCTAGFRIRKGGFIDLAIAFAKKPDVYKKRTGFAIVSGKLLTSNPNKIPGKYHINGKYLGDKPLKDILPVVINTIKGIEKKAKDNRRSCQSIQTRLVVALTMALHSQITPEEN